MTRGNEDADVLSLRAGAALAGYDLEELWLDCLILSGGHVPFDRVMAVVTEQGTDTALARNIVGLAVNKRLLRHGIPPLFQAQPIIDPDPDPG